MGVSSDGSPQPTVENSIFPGSIRADRYPVFLGGGVRSSHLG